MLKQPDLTPINDNQYELKHHYVYEGEDVKGKFRVIVPQGFITDGASIPQVFWSFTGLKPDGLHRAAALVHDFLYAYRGSVNRNHFQRFTGADWMSTEHQFSRKDADLIFKDLMEKASVGKVKLNTMYWAVRLFGWGPW